jgi:hypothetical protein
MRAADSGRCAVVGQIPARDLAEEYTANDPSAVRPERATISRDLTAACRRGIMGLLGDN